MAMGKSDIFASPWYWILLQVVITGVSIFITYWLYQNLTFQNAHKKIIKTILNGLDRRYVIKASDAYKELEEFKDK